VPEHVVPVNRAPVLALWGAVVAERMGYDWEASLTIGKVLSGLMAQSKGRQLGIYGPPKDGEGWPPQKTGLGEDFWVQLCGRGVPCKETSEGVRAVVEDKPVTPEAVEKYLQSRFGEALGDVIAAMRQLAAAHDPAELAEASYALYEHFRPKIARGKKGWGQKGDLDLDLIRSLAART
jgi:hypothetical protein